MCYEQCPNNLVSENNICVKMTKKTMLIIAFSSIACVIIIIILIIFLIKYI